MKVQSLRSLVDELLEDQQQLTAVERFSSQHERLTRSNQTRYRDLIPLRRPGKSEQYAFEVDLNVCSGCKACVVACHSQNGLDESESWRDVGTLVGREGQGSVHQTVTTACHHCEDPACLNGCPTRAYEKDAGSGIVRHLDDQCIGCRYCELKCPYEVPKYNERLGIVRKCDMCHGRLEEGEAPACVQACPNEAIKIRLVERGSVPLDETLVPGTVSNTLTKPTTRFLNVNRETSPVDKSRLEIAHSHLPLVAMLVLTQAGIGILIGDWMTRFSGGELGVTGPLVGAAIFFLGLAASVAHLGQPLKAWKAFLGWRRSWLSREILAFGAVAGMICLYFLSLRFEVAPLAIGAGLSGLGLLAIWTSVMVYADTARGFWTWQLNLIRFGCTAIGCALLFSPWPMWASLPILVTLGLDWTISQGRIGGLSKSARLLSQSLRRPLKLRFCFGILALLLIPIPALAVILFLCSESFGRYLFFTAVDEPAMPGL